MNLFFWSFAKIRNQLFQRVSLLYASDKLPTIIICFGIILRSVQYLINRSLWMDESFLALNIIDRSFLELLEPLDYNQSCPVGFLMLEKVSAQAFDNSEYALRLFPLFFGIISLFLFYSLTKRLLEQEAVPIALGLFATSTPLIYYSSEVKQYSSDVSIAIILYLVTIEIQSKRLDARHIFLFGIIGAIAIWFSYPSTFILAGVGSSITLFCIARKEWTKIGRFSIAYSLWALSFVACYLVCLRNISNNDSLLNYWSGSFMPFPPLSFRDARWFVDTFFRIFNNPVGLSLSGIAALTFLIGCAYMFSEKREMFFILISPAFFALLASSQHKYPFSGRLLLFIVPSLLIFIAEGAKQIRDKTRHSLAIIGATLMVLLFFHPLFSASYHLIKPKKREEIKPVINHVYKHWEDGDILYLYYGAWPAFEYYSKINDFNKSNYIKGIYSRGNWNNYLEDLNKLLNNKRVWILFSHVFTMGGINEEKFFVWYLDSIGTRLDSFKRTGASVYLYDLYD